MSTETDTARDFEAVALAFVEELTRGEAGALARYLDRYPRYARELSVLAFESAAGEEQVIIGKLTTPPAALRERLRADAHAALLPGDDTVVTNLLARARGYAGLNPRALARKLDIGVDVLALLEERHVAPDTVAIPFLTRLATTLGASTEAVRSYLAGPPLTVARGVAYHAPKGHTPARRISFNEAISQSNLMTPEQKAHWLDTETSTGQGLAG